jgi:hypothetical protein
MSLLTLPSRRDSRAGAVELARLVAAGWRKVQIEDVSVDVEAAAEGREPTAIVRARVHLGPLLPADVLVELDFLRRPSHPWSALPRRLWSMSSYHDGTYMFEARVPTGLLRRGGYVLRVSPSGDLPPDPAMSPVVAPVMPSSDAAP